MYYEILFFSPLPAPLSTIHYPYVALTSSQGCGLLPEPEAKSRTPPARSCAGKKIHIKKRERTKPDCKKAECRKRKKRRDCLTIWIVNK